MLIAVILLWLLSPVLTAQSNYKETYQKPFLNGEYPEKLPVLFRAYPVYQGDDRYVVYFPVEIRYDYLQFLSKDSEYLASAEIEIMASFKDGSKAADRIWKTQVSVSKFEATRNPRQHLLSLDSLVLASGNYSIRFKYRDLNGERQLAFNLPLTLSPVKQAFLGLPLFFHPDNPAAEALAELKQGQPSPLLSRWDFNRDLGMLFQIWLEKPVATRFRIEVIRNNDGETVFALDSTLQAGATRWTLPVEISRNNLKEGKYRLKTVLNAFDDSTRKVQPFEVVWFDKPRSLWDLELAIKPLQYITDASVYKSLDSGGAKERGTKLENFWEERDPTPDTPYNELEEEFYTRVDSTMIHYSSRRRQGWQTDPGKIYIAMGPPDHIDDQSLAPIEKPYMRWIYVLDDKEVTYTFYAVDGRKEYELAGTTEKSL